MKKGMTVMLKCKVCSCYQESLKNNDLMIFENIRVTVFLDCIFIHMQKPLCLQVHVDKKGKL